jgi:hypothetical protein
MSNRFVKVADHPTLIRDQSNKAILETDAVVLRKHEQRLKLLEKDKARDTELQFLRSQILEIKDLLKGLSANQDNSPK